MKSEGSLKGIRTDRHWEYELPCLLDRIEPLGPLLAAVRQHVCPCDRNRPALQSFATSMSGKHWLPSPPCTFFFRIDNLGFF